MNDNIFFEGDSHLYEGRGWPIRNLEDNPDEMIIGLDLSELPVRVIVTKIVTQEEGAKAVIPSGHVTFDDLDDFAAYWDYNWNFSGVFIAIPDDPADPLGVREWLESQGYPLEEYPHTLYNSLLEKDLKYVDIAVGAEFGPAYALAVQALYRREAPNVINGIWLKLYEVEFLIRSLRLEAHRLGAALESIPF